MNAPNLPDAAVRPRRAGTLVFLAAVLVDGAAMLGILWLLLDSVPYGIDPGALALAMAVLVAIVALVAGGLAARRRGRPGLAIALAAVPAVPALLLAAALAVFIATFNPHH